jgi:hypothetical protein
MIHSDLGIPTVQDIIHKSSNKHRAKLQSHPNSLLQSLSKENIPWRLKRRWPTDLKSGVRYSLAGGNLTTSKCPQSGLFVSIIVYGIQGIPIADKINKNKPKFP